MLKTSFLQYAEPHLVIVIVYTFLKGSNKLLIGDLYIRVYSP